MIRIISVVSTVQTQIYKEGIILKRHMYPKSFQVFIYPWYSHINFYHRSGMHYSQFSTQVPLN